MLKDCIGVFQRKCMIYKEKYGNEDKIILDGYIPESGDYILVGDDGNIKQHINIILDKHANIRPDIPEDILFYDYHSKIIDIRKNFDSKKIVQSNNFFAFACKWKSFTEEKMDEEAIDRYFDNLKNQKEKYYSSVKDAALYKKVEEIVGNIDQNRLEKNRKWIKENIFRLEELIPEVQKNGYLKIFFECSKEKFVNEEKRYLYVKLFNNNKYNIKIDKDIYGVPNNNMNLNHNKPYLISYDKKVPVPYLISIEEALNQKSFFDYLMNFANSGRTCIFFDVMKNEIYGLKKGELPEERFSGYFLQIKKGTELEIQYQSPITLCYSHLYKPFNLIEYVKRPITYISDPENNKVMDKSSCYKEYTTKKEIQELLHEVLFFNMLKNNYFSDVSDLPKQFEIRHAILSARDVIFHWVYDNDESRIASVLLGVCKDMIRYSVKNGYLNKAAIQINLLLSLIKYFEMDGGFVNIDEINDTLWKKMLSEDNEKICSNSEYEYALGQLIYYFVSLNKRTVKTHDLANQFFKISVDKAIKIRLMQNYRKYNYRVSLYNKRFNNLFKMVMNYEMKERIRMENVVCGYLQNSLIYKKA